VKNFTKRVRSAFAVGLTAYALAACKMDPNGLPASGFATVTGRVVDTQSLQPISGATISIGNIVAVTAAIDQGAFALRNVPLGARTITISAVGWKTYTGQVTVEPDTGADAGVIGLPSALAR
jgi:CarboxypepD_reg-like domain